MPWLLSGLGLLILLLAGDALVKGAVNLSLRLGVPALIVSLTIVAFGTSAPELLIAISAILDDAPGLALGNVVGIEYGERADGAWGAGLDGDDAHIRVQHAQEFQLHAGGDISVHRTGVSGRFRHDGSARADGGTGLRAV